MSARSRRKGANGERELARLAREHGLEAERTWHTAQSPNDAERVKDIRIGSDFYQVQVAADGFGRIYRELEGVRGFFFRSDRREWLIALRAEDFLKMLAELLGEKGAGGKEGDKGDRRVGDEGGCTSSTRRSAQRSVVRH